MSDNKKIPNQNENKKTRDVQVCWRCNGNGFIANAFTTKLVCPRCNGTGKISNSRFNSE